MTSTRSEFCANKNIERELEDGNISTTKPLGKPDNPNPNQSEKGKKKSKVTGPAQ